MKNFPVIGMDGMRKSFGIVASPKATALKCFLYDSNGFIQSSKHKHYQFVLFCFHGFFSA